MKGSGQSISLAGSELTDVRHVCALFNSDEEEYRVLLPFIQDGFKCGDKAIHIVSPDQQADHIQRLSSAGIDIEVSKRNDQLKVLSSTDTYLQDGHFDYQRLVDVFRQFASSSGEGGSAVNRFVCRMDWAADGRTHLDNLIEFESRVNDVWSCCQDAVVCTYRLSQFSGDAVIDIVRTHPFVIIGGILRRNPFFVPPEQFLPELRARRRLEIALRMGV
jgi:hypothetical protein